MNDMLDTPAPVAPPEALIPETGGKSDIELRGYELAELEHHREGRRWRVVSKHPPNESGFRKAAADGEYLQGRYPKSTYRIRPIISVPFPDTLPVRAAESAPEETNVPG